MRRSLEETWVLAGRSLRRSLRNRTVLLSYLFQPLLYLVIFTKVDSIRTADPEELAARYIELYGKMAQVAPTLEDALGIANRAPRTFTTEETTLLTDVGRAISSQWKI